MHVHLYALVDGLLFADTAGGSPPERTTTSMPTLSAIASTPA